MFPANVGQHRVTISALIFRANDLEPHSNPAPPESWGNAQSSAVLDSQDIARCMSPDYCAMLRAVLDRIYVNDRLVDRLGAHITM